MSQGIQQLHGRSTSERARVRAMSEGILQDRLLGGGGGGNPAAILPGLYLSTIQSLEDGFHGEHAGIRDKEQHRLCSKTWLYSVKHQDKEHRKVKQTGRLSLIIMTAGELKDSWHAPSEFRCEVKIAFAPYPPSCQSSGPTESAMHWYTDLR